MLQIRYCKILQRLQDRFNLRRISPKGESLPNEVRNFFRRSRASTELLRSNCSTPAILRFNLDHGSSQILRSEEHTSELQSLMRISYAVFCLQKKRTTKET